MTKFFCPVCRSLLLICHTKRAADEVSGIRLCVYVLFNCIACMHLQITFVSMRNRLHTKSYIEHVSSLAYPMSTYIKILKPNKIFYRAYHLSFFVVKVKRALEHMQYYSILGLLRKKVTAKIHLCIILWNKCKKKDLSKILI